MSNKGLLVACVFLVFVTGVFQVGNNLPPTYTSQQLLLVVTFIQWAALLGAIYTIIQIVRAVYKKKPPI